MMKILLYTAFILLFLSCTTQNKMNILVENISNLYRLDEIIEIKIDEFSDLNHKDKQSYIVRDESGVVIPSQITFDGKLIFQASVESNESVKYTISVDTLRAYNSQVFGRHYPERYGDFAWENDRVGFRFYGGELKEIQAPTSGLDLWYKRTGKLVLDEWYCKDISGEASYHKDNGEGCDPYAVGQTLGGGSMAILVDSVLHLNENFENFEVLDNGPLRVTFRLIYPILKINGQEVSETKTISLDAGSQLTKIIQEYITSEPITVATGFPKRASGDSIVYIKGQNYFVYQEPMSEENGQIYLGILIPKGIDNVFVNNTTQVGNSDKKIADLPNVIASREYLTNEPLTYYTGFGWNKFGFNNIKTFNKYMEEYSQKIAHPLQVTIK